MSETASGLLRVVLLALATATFAAVWRGDQLTQQRFILARKDAAQQKRQIRLAEQDRLETVALIRSQTADVARVIEPHIEPHEDDASFASPSYVARVEIEMELPAGIAAGRYQTVDESGLIQTIHIHGGTAAQDDRDIYILDRSDGSRRVFIRTGDPAEPTTASVQSVRR